MFQASMGPFGGVGSCCPQAPRVLCRRTRMCRPASTGTADTARLTPADARAVPEQGKGKSVIARWRLEEAPSKEARRRTGTEYEVWYTWDELARTAKPSIRGWMCSIHLAPTHGQCRALPWEVRSYII
jgi:hypothetical protein